MRIWALIVLLLSTSCSPLPRGSLTVAAAANLADVFTEVGTAFKARTGSDVVYSYGSTAQLAQQIGNGAPMDVFAAADTEHIDSLIESKKLLADSKAVYARGQLALWIPKGVSGAALELRELASPRYRFIAVAQPEFAPYGKAALEALKASNLWETVEPKIVYASSIRQAKQMAASGNADAALTAYSLVLHESGSVLKVDPRLYRPLDQALSINASAANVPQAWQFREFLLSGEGQAILAKYGYLRP
jgi:molybdate transport system substrate-binding protein